MFFSFISQFTIKHATKAQSTDRFILLLDNACCRLVSFSQSILPVATETSDRLINQLLIPVFAEHGDERNAESTGADSDRS